MIMEDIEVLKKVQKDRNQSKSNLQLYKSASEQYTKLHKLSLKELIDEAIKEQENNLSWKN